MKTRQTKMKKLMLSKKIIVKLNHTETRELFGGDKTSTIPTCVSNDFGCIFRITR